MDPVSFLFLVFITCLGFVILSAVIGLIIVRLKRKSASMAPPTRSTQRPWSGSARDKIEPPSQSIPAHPESTQQLPPAPAHRKPVAPPSASIPPTDYQPSPIPSKPPPSYQPMPPQAAPMPYPQQAAPTPVYRPEAFSQPSRTITRYPDVAMRDKVVLKQRCTLRVAVTLQPVKEEFEQSKLLFSMPYGAENVAVDVLLTAEDFEIIGDEFRQLIIPAGKDSDPLIFEMVPQTVGNKKVKVEFFQNHKYIGGITATTRVVMSDEASGAMQTSTQGIVEVDKRSVPPDLTILITEAEPGGNQRRYKFKLHSPQNGLYFYPIVEELAFTGSPSQWVEGLYTELSTLAEKESSYNLPETLSTIGSDLYEKLFPRELKEVWRKRISGRVSSIMIISDEPWIPWEIIKPSYETETGSVEEENFLCEEYQLTRWIAGPPPPSRLMINKGATIAPLVTNLPNVQREVEFLELGFGLINIRPRLDGVRELLRQGGVQLIHFACHGSFDPEEHEQSVIYLEENERLRSRDIAGARKNFGRDRPFIFINACQTARAEFSLVGIGSWADKFIRAQASGFLGSSWEVNDEFAFEFTKSFYRALIQGRTIGEAVKEARLRIKNENDTTWLAYSVYADPLAEVYFI